MKKNSIAAIGTLWRKDPNNENGVNSKAVKLEDEAVLGRLEEPLIVAPSWKHVEEILMWKGALLVVFQETGGKQLAGRSRQGNRWAKTVLIQAAHAAGHTQTYLGAQYRRLSARRGAKKAAMAVGHSILVIFYHMVKSGEPYHEKGVDYFTTLNKEKIQRRHVRQLERLGNTVILQPKAEMALA